MSKFLFVIIFLYKYLFSFLYYGKLGMMGNFAGWRNEQGCTRYVECLPNGTYQSPNKDARVKLYIHKAKPCILFCLAPCASVSFLDQGGLFECLVCSCCSLVVFFSFLCKRLVDSKHSRRSKDLFFLWKNFIFLFVVHIHA